MNEQFLDNIQEIFINSKELYQDQKSDRKLNIISPTDVFYVSPYIHETDDATPLELEWSRQRATQKTLPSMGFYELRNVNIRGSGFVFKNNHILGFEDLVPLYVYDQIKNNNRWDLNEKRLNEIFIAGKTVVFVSDAHIVYGHWILDILPRLWFFQKYWPGDKSRIQFLIPSNTPIFAREILRSCFDIAQENIREFHITNDRVLLEFALVPSMLHASHIFHPLMNEFVSDIQDRLGILSNAGKRDNPKKIYLSREHTRITSSSFRRSISNERDLIKELELLGFEIIVPETMSWIDQLKIYSNTSVFIAEGGSGLHNSIFSNDQASVISIDNPNHVQGMIANLRRQNLRFFESEVVDAEKNIRKVNINRFLDLVTRTCAYQQ